MKKHDVIRFIGRFPDKITDKSIMDVGKWFCSHCGKPKPKGKEPCECGSIFWYKPKGCKICGAELGVKEKVYFDTCAACEDKGQ